MAPNQALELQAPKETEGTLNLHTKWLQLFKWSKYAQNDVFSTTKTTFSGWGSAWCVAAEESERLGRCRHWPGPRLSESRPGRAEGGLYVQGSKPRRAEGALYVPSTCLDVQRNFCTFKLWRHSIY